MQLTYFWRILSIQNHSAVGLSQDCRIYKESGDLGVIYLALCCLFGLPVYVILRCERGHFQDFSWKKVDIFFRKRPFRRKIYAFGKRKLRRYSGHPFLKTTMNFSLTICAFEIRVVGCFGLHSFIKINHLKVSHIYKSVWIIFHYQFFLENAISISAAV